MYYIIDILLLDCRLKLHKLILDMRFIEYYIPYNCHHTRLKIRDRIVMSLSQTPNHEIYDRHLQQLGKLGDSISKKIRLSTGELIFLVSFIANFFLGKLIHLTAEHEEVYNYYNNKRNVFNQVFVKRGWGWTTLIIVVFYSFLMYGNSHARIRTKQQRISVLKKAIFNYIVATLWWVLFTQWCFGLPLMDKVFVWTGGKCTGIAQEKLALHIPSYGTSSIFTEIESDLSYESKAITSYMCRKLKGSWEGGHDPSGHVFLLIHSSLYLFLEALPFWISWATLKHHLCQFVKSWRLTSGSKPKLLFGLFAQDPHTIIIPLISLWWFMLFMTNIYFHSIGEKLVGLVFGYVGLAVVYYVPRWL